MCVGSSSKKLFEHPSHLIQKLVSSSTKIGLVVCKNWSGRLRFFLAEYCRSLSTKIPYLNLFLSHFRSNEGYFRPKSFNFLVESGVQLVENGHLDDERTKAVRHIIINDSNRFVFVFFVIFNDLSLHYWHITYQFFHPRVSVYFSKMYLAKFLFTKERKSLFKLYFWRWNCIVKNL